MSKVRGYNKKQVMEMEFPTTEYSFPESIGSFTGTLVMKKWTDKPALLCYFDTTDGEKLKLQVYWHSDNDRSYRPKNSDVDISEIQIGTALRVGYEKSKKGYTTWLTVKTV